MYWKRRLMPVAVFLALWACFFLRLLIDHAPQFSIAIVLLWAALLSAFVTSVAFAGYFLLRWSITRGERKNTNT